VTSLASKAHAQYTTAPTGPYTGGQVIGGSSVDPTSASYGPVSGGYGANGGASGGTTTSCSGAITATFNWTGIAPAPQSAIVVETSTVFASADCYGYQAHGPPSAACADGMGDTATINTSYPPHNSQEVMSGSVSRTRYTNQGGQTITLNCSPSASAYTPNGPASHADVAYSAAVYPVTISPGGATSDGYGGYDILVGQHCAPTLSPPPPGCTYSNYQWSVTGTPFQKWTVSADQSQATLATGPGATNVASPSWYWTELNQTTETITCTATVTPPTGEGSAFTVTATQKVTVMVPFVQASGTAGYMSVPQGGNLFYLNASPKTQITRGGMDFDAVVVTPTSPAFGDGQVQMVQIAIPNESYVVYSTGVNDPDPENNHTGLDTGYPYGNTPQNPNGGVVVTEPTEFQTQDSPHLLLQNGTLPIASSATMTHQFQDTLMYQPPNGQWVPVATFTWGTNGNATIPSTDNWGNYPSGQSPPYYSAGTVSPSGLFTLSDQFPTWVAIDKFPTF
jgi:hypothetical protein